MKTDKIFIDSNIWLYSFIKTPEVTKYELAKLLIQNNINRISISTQVINEVSYTLHRKKLFTEKQIQDLIQSFYEFCFVQNHNQTNLTQASLLREMYHFSFWNSLIVASALEQKCTSLFSEDMHQGLVIEKQLIIVNPFKII
jgi:predicted nucleic acid-binding protein